MASPKPQVQFGQAYVTGVVDVYAKVSFGASGAPTLSTAAGEALGVTTVTRASAGLYSFTFAGPFQKILAADVIYEVTATGIGAAPGLGIRSFTPSTGILLLTTFDLESPAATDPASGDVGYFHFVFKNTTAN